MGTLIDIASVYKSRKQKMKNENYLYIKKMNTDNLVQELMTRLENANEKPLSIPTSILLAEFSYRLAMFENIYVLLASREKK